MKTKITFLAILCSVFSFGQVGTIFTFDGINYKITGAAMVEITENSNISSEAEAVLPQNVYFNNLNYQVTRIGNNAFNYYNYNCKAITIPNSVTSIGNDAFSGCEELISINVPISLTSIGDNAFYCRSLNVVILNNTSPLVINRNIFGNFHLYNLSLMVPAGTQSLYESASVWKDFYSISESNTEPVQIGQQFVSDGINYIVRKASYPFEVAVANNRYFVGDAQIPNFVSNAGNSFAVTSIGNGGFSSSSLTSVNIPDTVLSIGNVAFDGCPNLTSLTLGNSVRSIGYNAFKNCNSLNFIKLNNVSVVELNADVFENLYLSDLSLIVPQGRQLVYKFAQGWKDFYNISETNSGSVEVGQMFTVNSINYVVRKSSLPYEVAVANNKNFVGVATIPSFVSYSSNSFSVTSVGNSAFSLCDGLTSVNIPESVTSIGNAAFSNCHKLTSFNIPNGVKSIGGIAFASNEGILSVSIPKSVTRIGSSAFYLISNLKSVTLQWTIPLPIDRTTFQTLDISKISLYVPSGTEFAYKAANVWKEFKIETTLETNSFSLNNAAKFYPNPAKSQINFSQEINTLEVFDIAGKKVKSFQNLSSNYDISNLQKGVYILKGKTTDGKSVNEKLVKE